MNKKLKAYFMVVVSDYEVLGTRRMEETDAYPYEEYPTDKQIAAILETYEARYARVEKRYRLVDTY